MPGASSAHLRGQHGRDVGVALDEVGGGALGVGEERAGDEGDEDARPASSRPSPRASSGGTGGLGARVAYRRDGGRGGRSGSLVARSGRAAPDRCRAPPARAVHVGARGGSAGRCARTPGSTPSSGRRASAGSSTMPPTTSDPGQRCADARCRRGAGRSSRGSPRAGGSRKGSWPRRRRGREDR